MDTAAETERARLACNAVADNSAVLPRCRGSHSRFSVLPKHPLQRYKVDAVEASASIYGEGSDPLPVERCVRYGRLTLVPSPVAEMLKVPAVLFGAYEYACQPVGGAGIDAMNGPAVWF
jgi:hypothetical protein